MRILFLGPTRSSFANVDIAILSEEHTVIALDSVLGYGVKGLLGLFAITLRSFVHLLRADTLYCWFADYHTMLPAIVARMLGKKVVVVAGGYDIGYEPQINFGARIRPIRWFCVRCTFALAHLILPVSQYALAQLKKLVPDLDVRTQVIYNAVRTDLLTNEQAIQPRKPMAMMISQGDSDVEIRRKGVDSFVEIAESMPDVEFRLIGLAAGHVLVQSAGARVPNLKLYPGFVSFDEVIIPSFKESAVYLQPSVEEAFGVAVVEGMSCGCIPVVCPSAALPEVVGPLGRYCSTIDQFQTAIREAVVAAPEVRAAIRQRALSFTVDVRRTSLLSAMRSVGSR